MAFSSCTFFARPSDEQEQSLVENNPRSDKFTKILNRGKVISASVMFSAASSMLSDRFLFSSLNEPFRTTAAAGVGVVVLLVVLPIAWKYAPCILAEKCKEQEEMENRNSFTI